jgi:hypothetical protein
LRRIKDFILCVSAILIMIFLPANTISGAIVTVTTTTTATTTSFTTRTLTTFTYTTTTSTYYTGTYTTTSTTTATRETVQTITTPTTMTTTTTVIGYCPLFRGHVYYTDSSGLLIGLPSATVTLSCSSLSISTTTNADGYFEIQTQRHPNDNETCTLTASSKRYPPKSVTFQYSPYIGNYIVNFALSYKEEVVAQLFQYNVVDFTVSPNGTLYFIIYDTSASPPANKIYKLENGRLVLFRDPHPQDAEEFSGLSFARDGSLYLVGNAGGIGKIFRFTPGAITYDNVIYQRKNLGEYIRGFAFQSKDLLYILTEKDEIVKVSDGVESFVYRPTEMDIRYFHGLAMDSKGFLYVGDGHRGVGELYDSICEIFRLQDGQPRLAYTSTMKITYDFTIDFQDNFYLIEPSYSNPKNNPNIPTLIIWKVTAVLPTDTLMLSLDLKADKPSYARGEDVTLTASVVYNGNALSGVDDRKKYAELSFNYPSLYCRCLNPLCGKHLNNLVFRHF